MKKLLCIGLIVALAVTAMVSLVSCANKFEPDAKVVEAIKDAETLSHDELFKKAADELGAKGQLRILATTSRGGKSTVKDLFISELQKHNSAITADALKYDTTVDGQIYTTLQGEIEAGVQNYCGMVTQDGYQLQTKGIDTGYYLNFVPKTWKEAQGVDLTASNPFALQYNFKTWMYNNKGKPDMVIDNVWDVTDSQYKGKIFTMDPRNENVNMDWLVQLTTDEQNAALKAAWEDASKTTDLKLTDYEKYGEKKYAYAFIGKFIENAVFYGDDGEAMTNLAKTPGAIGWIVYSKIMKVEESGDISKSNIVIAALGKDNSKDAPTASAIKGFAGFMYKHYLQVMPNCKYPYATCAFFELISTNATAYSVWAGDPGDYPTLPSINKDRTQGGYVEGVNTYPALNDPSSTWWINTGKAVVENPATIASNYKTLQPFLLSAIANK